MVDLRPGLLVVETPRQARGMFDDRWRQWIVDFGLPSPGRGAGGRFLLVPPGYNGPLAESGHSRTTRAFLLGRAFMEDDGLRRRADHRYPSGPSVREASWTWSS